MEAALKAARAQANKNGRRRHRIIALENGFHGRTDGSLALTAKAEYASPFSRSSPASCSFPPTTSPPCTPPPMKT